MKDSEYKFQEEKINTIFSIILVVMIVSLVGILWIV